MTAASVPNTDLDPSDPYAPVEVNLKNPPVAALLAWLWPGAGHVYQQRYGKGLLFMACILTTYFFGLGIGNGHVVYASFSKPHIRFPYLLQVGVGLPALPALVQSSSAPAEDKGWSRLMAPPADYDEQEYDELAWWHDQTGYFFEFGTLFTMIAGLLNVLAIYDAYAGPVFTHPNPKKHAAAVAASAAATPSSTPGS